VGRSSLDKVGHNENLAPVREPPQYEAGHPRHAGPPPGGKAQLGTTWGPHVPRDPSHTPQTDTSRRAAERA